MSAFSEFASVAEADGRAALVSVLEGADTSAKLFVRTDGSTVGGLGSPELDGAAEAAADELMWSELSERREVGEVTLFVDVTAPAPRLVIFGAVDYSAALARLARAAGWRPFVCYLAHSSPPTGAFRTPSGVAAWPAEAFERIGASIAPHTLRS